MKKQYEKPELKLFTFLSEDVMGESLDNGEIDPFDQLILGIDGGLGLFR